MERAWTASLVERDASQGGGASFVNVQAQRRVEHEPRRVRSYLAVPGHAAEDAVDPTLPRVPPFGAARGRRLRLERALT